MWSGDDPAKDGVAQTNSNKSAIEEVVEGSLHQENPVGRSRQNSRANIRHGRERCLSVPSRGEASNVETVMTKAKRASSYLWMLLHSQSCRLGVDRCTHSGCADAKLMHLHLKTCPAGHDFPCPTRHSGCLEARKLLAHYRRCRNVRARQVGQSPGTGKGQHVCLICSMVARQARSLLDNNMQSSSNNSRSQGPIVAHKKGSTKNTKCQVVSASFTVKASINASTLSSSFTAAADSDNHGQRKILSSFTLSPDTSSAQFFPQQQKTQLEWGMPPPAPRPSSTRLSHSAPASPMCNHDEKQELKGKNGSLLLKPMPLFRKRSESLGSEGTSTSTSGRQSVVSFAARPELLDTSSCVGGPDSALVSVELSTADHSSVVGGGGNSSPTRRGRSASCHLLSASTSSETCGTIYEEIGTAASCMDE